MKLISRARLAEFDDAYSYGHVTPIAWLYRELLALHEAIEQGNAVRVDDGSGTVLHVPDQFAAWVRQTYPGFKDDPLHPAFSEQ